MIVQTINIISSFIAALILHELGHYVAARACGVPVTQLGLGWGPTLFRSRLSNFDFTVRLLPLGAYVRLDMNQLLRRPVVLQLIVFSAGIFANLLLAAITWRTTFSALNLGLALGNLLPLYQQDGWKSCMVLSRWICGRANPVIEWSLTIVGGILGLGVLLRAISVF
ncbi:MAG: hypothetical protein C5B55_14820 [Blastocatellia bacterium]|nr:MAG: hypothetical protein C5B55_14820 [Blastocatellia bacterium]